MACQSIGLLAYTLVIKVHLSLYECCSTNSKDTPKPSESYIKEQSKVFGRNPNKPVQLTKYQLQVNDAAAELCFK